MENGVDKGILELIEEAKAGDRAAQSKIVENNMGLVWSVVRRFSNRGYESDDLFQIGSIGLIKAIKKFDASFKVRFSTYAVPMIVGEIKRFIRDDGIIKVSRGLKEISNRVNITKEIMAKELGREPTLAEIADRMKVCLEDIVLAMEANCVPESLHGPMYQGEGRDMLLIDSISSQGGGIEPEERIALKQVLQDMEPRDRQIIILRYFKEKTQSEVAAMLGISQVQVSRVEKKILSNMKKKIMES